MYINSYVINKTYAFLIKINLKTSIKNKNSKLSQVLNSYKREKCQEYIKSQKDIAVAIKLGKFSTLR